jgi:hypothetical protein
MKKTSMVIAYLATLLALRAADAFLTYQVVEVRQIARELNPLMTTGSVISGLLSPASMIVCIAVTAVFGWMVFRSERLLADEAMWRRSMSLASFKIYPDVPMLLLAILGLAVLQNFTLLVLGTSLLPAAINDYTRLILMLVLVYAIAHRFIRRATYKILKYASRPSPRD